MADNVEMNAGSGGAVIMADEISAGVFIQRVKPAWGADGSATDVADTTGQRLPVKVGEQPARAAATDTIGAALMTDVINSGTTALTPKFASVAASSSGNNTLVAAVASKKIRVVAAALVAASAVTVKFQSGASGTDLTGAMSLAANGGFVLPFNPVGWVETASNTLLNLSLGGAVSVTGCIAYVEV